MIGSHFEPDEKFLRLIFLTFRWERAFYMPASAATVGVLWLLRSGAQPHAVRFEQLADTRRGLAREISDRRGRLAQIRRIELLGEGDRAVDGSVGHARRL